MRHGKPEMDLNAIRKIRMSPHEMGQIIRDYENSELNCQQQIPTDSNDIANQCDVFFASELVRAQSSIMMLDKPSDVIYNSCFNESNLPYQNWRSPKFTFFTWAILFRIAWMLGFNKNGESIKSGQERAQIAATKLINHTSSDQNTLLLGHGIMNRLVAKQLKQNAWRQTYNSGNGYWSYVVFEK